MADGSFADGLLAQYLDGLSPSLRPGTIRNKSLYARNFLEYAESRGVTNLLDVEADLVYEFVGTLGAYASQPLSNVRFTLRELFDVLHGRGLAPFDGRTLFPVVHTNKRDRILSRYSADEVRAIVAQADVGSPNGVRDKCMVLLAAQLGLRQSDILDLRLGDIRWDLDLIERVQVKTGEPLSLPLPENLKLLLADYIMEHRPDSETDYVFVREGTGERFCESQVYAVMRRLMRRSGVEPDGRKHGPHALRHSLATSMLDSQTPLPAISSVLGHSSTQSTTVYIGVDVEALRALSLEVPGDEG
jgi:integrase